MKRTSYSKTTVNTWELKNSDFETDEFFIIDLEKGKLIKEDELTLKQLKVIENEESKDENENNKPKYIIVRVHKYFWEDEEKPF